MAYDGEIIEHADGIYLNMRHAEYLNDPALGSGSITTLLRSPPEWWWESSYNTIARPLQKEAKHFLFGTAAHVMFLEGDKVYHAAYGAFPTVDRHPEHLDTLPQLRERCVKLKLASTGDKPALIARILEKEPDAKIFQKLVNEWMASGRTPLKHEQDASIRLLYQMAMRSPKDLHLPTGESLTLKQAFTGGLSEVSVFWTDEDGVRQKARFDKLKPNITIDFKTIDDWRKSDFKKALLKEVVIRGYVVQAVHYDEARCQLAPLLKAGKVYGVRHGQMGILREIARAKTWAWGWVFAKTEGYPAVRGIIPNRDVDTSLGPTHKTLFYGDQFMKAVQQRREALANFAFFKELFGLERGKMWMDYDTVWEPAETDWDPFSVLGQS